MGAIRRGGRAVECGGLENRFGSYWSDEGSNPSPSASFDSSEPRPRAIEASSASSPTWSTGPGLSSLAGREHAGFRGAYGAAVGRRGQGSRRAGGGDGAPGPIDEPGVRVAGAEAVEVGWWARELGVDRSELLREALHTLPAFVSERPWPARCGDDRMGLLLPVMSSGALAAVPIAAGGDGLPAELAPVAPHRALAGRAAVARSRRSAGGESVARHRSSAITLRLSLMDAAEGWFRIRVALTGKSAYFHVDRSEY